MFVVEFLSQPIWHRLSLTLVHFLWQGLAVALITCTAVRLLRLQRGNPRYASYFVAFVVMAACPLVTFAVLAMPAEPTVSTPAPRVESSGPFSPLVPSSPLQQISEYAPSASPARHILLRENFGGTYRLSAVTQHDSGNVFVSHAQATVKADEKLTVNIVPPPRGDCSLRGVITGRRGTYWSPTPRPQQTNPQWFVLIRTRGSGPVEQTNAYEAQTMDSHYVVRGQEIVQETEDRARYAITGIAPGEYTVTVIEHPWYKGLPIERQQSQSLTLRPGETATLDFDLRDQAMPQDNRSRWTR